MPVLKSILPPCEDDTLQLFGMEGRGLNLNLVSIFPKIEILPNVQLVAFAFKSNGFGNISMQMEPACPNKV